LKLPYTLQWNVAAQQNLGSSQSLTVSYVGSLGRRLLRLSEYSTQIVGFGTSLIPSYLQNNQSYSNYNALQLQIQRRLTKGLQALGSYTWAHSLDTSSGDDVAGLPPQLVSLKVEYAPSDFDVRHVMTGALTYDLPKVTSTPVLSAIAKGWGLDLRESYRTGFPVNVLSSTLFGTLTFSNHPDLVPGVPEVLYGAGIPGGKEINPAAFVPAPTNVLGDFPRNGLRGFGATQMDLALRRTFTFTERVKLQFRAEFFNIMNHPNFSDYGGSTSTANWFVSQKTLANGLGGVNALYQMGGPRSAQLSAKILF
jgi:hypothetical protein